MKIGIIGAENSHTAAIAKTINIEKKIRGFSVDYVWGETQDFARAAAESGQIPNIVKTPKQMLGKIDALVVDHRHAKHHLKAALPFMEQGIPTFIDKPFCYRASEGVEFLKIARKNNAPVTSFSAIPHQQSFKQFVKKMAGMGDIVTGATYGPCDLNSKYGGVFFYGIHQVEMALVAFGYDVSSVLVTRNKKSSTGQLIYSSGKVVTMNFIKEAYHGFAIAVVGSGEICHQPITFDKNPNLNGIEMFCGMFRTGKEPLTHEQVLKPVQVLQALEMSAKSGKMEKVGK